MKMVNQDSKIIREKSNWDKPLPDWIKVTGVGLLINGGICHPGFCTFCLGPENDDLEGDKVERNDGWGREPFVGNQIAYV
jgi:hypothetical protein